MLTPGLSIFISALLLCVLVLLFRHEENRGIRPLARIRTRADFLVLEIKHFFHTRLRRKSHFVIKQIFHYIVHTLLTRSIYFLSRTEMWLKSLVNSNKTLAKRSERERVTRNKLEEIALHKMEVALTEDEKKKHKDKMLQG